MSDRKLLEDAAKAAGYKVHERLMRERGVAVPDEIALALSEPGTTWWNPLTDDGDALRLAVKLRIDFCIDPDDTMACAWCEPISDFMQDDLATDEMAATRRAIVRAAAAIGGGE